MESEIVKYAKPVSFIEDVGGLSRGQKLLLELLCQKIKSDNGIKIDDIKSCYYDAVSRDGYLNWTDWSTGGSRQRKITKDEFIQTWQSRQKSLQWFKSNIGSVILKGKLLIIPLIDI